jgi:hypothetical protein
VTSPDEGVVNSHPIGEPQAHVDEVHDAEGWVQ